MGSCPSEARTQRLQAEQIRIFCEAWAEQGWQGTPRVSVSRSIIPLIDDETERYFGGNSRGEGGDQVGYIDGFLSRFGRSYIGRPDRIAEELARDAAVAEADTLLMTVPNQLGVDFNARTLESIVNDVLPALPSKVGAHA